MSGSIYFDYNATTPLDSGVHTVVSEALRTPWANPSSVHHLGRIARSALDDARDRLAARFQAKPSEILFTSGGTEANNLAVFGGARCRRDRGRHLVCSPVEHPAVLHCHRQLAAREGYEVHWLPVNAAGQVDPDDVRRALRTDTVLVSVMAVNNETGVIQPVTEIGRLCRERGVLFHTDAVQAFGKLPVTSFAAFEADLVTVCAHKLHGPRGAGLLYARSPLLPEPLLFGGGQENERRAGTENLPAILGFAAALERFVTPPVFAAERLAPWINRLQRVLTGIDGVFCHGENVPRVANTLSFSVNGTDSIALLANLDLRGIGASSGSACSSGSVEPSHVLRAMGCSAELAASLVRFSLGRETTEAEVETVAAVLPEVIALARAGGG